VNCEMGIIAKGDQRDCIVQAVATAPVVISNDLEPESYLPLMEAHEDFPHIHSPNSPATSTLSTGISPLFNSIPIAPSFRINEFFNSREFPSHIDPAITNSEWIAGGLYRFNHPEGQPNQSLTIASLSGTSFKPNDTLAPNQTSFGNNVPSGEVIIAAKWTDHLKRPDWPYVVKPRANSRQPVTKKQTGIQPHRPKALSPSKPTLKLPTTNTPQLLSLSLVSKPISPVGPPSQQQPGTHGGQSISSFTPSPVAKDGRTTCANCHTTKTPLWRRDREGQRVCNACSLFFKNNGAIRPLYMNTGIIKKRNRRRGNSGWPNSANVVSTVGLHGPQHSDLNSQGSLASDPTHNRVNSKVAWERLSEKGGSERFDHGPVSGPLPPPEPSRPV